MKNMMIKTAAALVMVFFLSGIAMAEMVDIGMGQMDKGDFEQIKAMVAGQVKSTDGHVTSNRDVEQVYGLVKMSPVDFDNMKKIVAGEFIFSPADGSSHPIELISIGPGKMTRDDFNGLKIMVEDHRHNYLENSHLAHFLHNSN